MKKNFFPLKRVMTVLLILFCALTLVSCWGQNELNEIALVTDFGLDVADNGEIIITALAIIPSGGTQMQASSKSNVWVGTAVGTSLEDAVENLDKIASRELVWYHNSVVVIGSKSVDKVLTELADYSTRYREPRFSQKILITEGTAFELLNVPADVQSSISEELAGIIKNTSSRAYVPDMKDYLSSESEKNSSSLLGRISFETSSRNTYATNREETRKEYWLDKEFGILSVDGCSVIKDGKFAGFLDSKETRGCLWMINKIKGGTITAVQGEEKLVFKYRKAETTIKPELEDGKIKFKIKSYVKGGLIETTANSFNVLSEDDNKKMQGLWEVEIENEMKAALGKLQKQYNADAIGFGAIVKKKYPKEWKKIESDWQDIFPTVEVEYEIKVILRRYGNISAPIIETSE